MSKGGVNDAIFKIENHQRTFYINRGFDHINEKTLRSLIGSSGVFYFNDFWNPLDPLNNASNDFVRIESNEKVIFNQ